MKYKFPHLKYKIFPFSKSLNEKWWHRLAKVLIFTMSILAFIFGALVTKLSIDETRYQHQIYNFERGYLSSPGWVAGLSRYNASYDFLDRLIRASHDRIDTDREFIPKESSEEFVNKLRNEGPVYRTDYDVKNIIFDALEDSKPNAQVWKIKTWYEYSYFPEGLWLLFGPICYFLLIGMYGVILYVAYGSNPFKTS